MARTSTRESVYPTGAGGTTSFDFLNHLEDCVTATEECTATLQAGLDRLEPGIRDLPRLTKVLGNRHVRCVSRPLHETFRADADSTTSFSLNPRSNRTTLPSPPPSRPKSTA